MPGEPDVRTAGTFPAGSPIAQAPSRTRWLRLGAVDATGLGCPAEWTARRRALAPNVAGYERRLQLWLLWLLQDQMMIFVPFAVLFPLASRHLPDCTPVMVPLEFTFHCWFA